MTFPPATRAQVADLLALRTPGDRRASGRCLVEGATLLGEALDAGLVPALVAVGPAPREPALAVVARAQAAGAPVVQLDQRGAARLSDRENAPGLLAAVPLPPAWDRQVPETGPVLVLALCGLQDPGNVGTLLRAALAFGARACVLTAGSADPFGPKVVRASAGAAFRLPVLAAELDDVAALAGARHLELLAAVPADAASPAAPAAPESAVLPARCVLLLGHETRGVPVLAGCRAVTVPHEPVVNSLNVAVAGAILLAGWYRARRP